MERYTISQYAKLLQDANLLESFISFGAEDKLVEFLTYDSREVTEGTLFICKGAAFKEEYLSQAVSQGAAFYVSEKKYQSVNGVPRLIVNNIRKSMALLANFYDGEPWKEMNVTAIGGTKGKTTTAFFIKGIADTYMKALGKVQSGLVSTVSVCDGIKTVPSRRTTPEAVELQHILRGCVDNGVTRLCMEVSSQGLKYDRVAGMRFNMSIFLNISEDHISPHEHPDFDDYLNSKLKMFAMSDKTVINLDADHIDRILNAACDTPEVYTFSSSRREADFFIYDIGKDGRDTVFKIQSKDFDEEFRISMAGLFNVENAAAAIVASFKNEIPMEYIKEGIYNVKPDGRMEIFSSDDESVICVVDYAHNGFSMEKLLSSLKSEYPDRQLTVLFGSAGDKAFGRRRELGETAGRFADRIILTADDPAHEKVEDICQQIAQHIPSDIPYEIIPDREEAAKAAITKASKPAVVALAGKGPETDQAIGDGYVKCLSDAQLAQKYLREI